MIDFTRRRFLSGLAATPLIVPAAKHFVMPNLAAIVPGIAEPEHGAFDYTGADLTTIRDLLLPGLRALTGEYTALPAMWREAFSTGC